jgi:hypothetical protein
MTDSEIYYQWPPTIINKEDLMRYFDEHGICYTVKLSVEELKKLYPNYPNYEAKDEQ